MIINLVSCFFSETQCSYVNISKSTLFVSKPAGAKGRSVLSDLR